jgi:imidazolonepropionase-like amidohydrolase
MGTEIGSLEPGKLADLIVVDGNPVEDIALLQDEARIPIVMRSGRLVKGGA